jgi:hypothetical protein
MAIIMGLYLAITPLIAQQKCVIAQINEVEIQQASKEVARDLRYNAWLRYATYCGLTVGVGLLAYKWLYGGSADKIAAKAQADGQAATPINLNQAEIAVLLKYADESKKLMIANQTASASFMGWLKMNINGSIQQVGALLMLEALRGGFKPINDLLVVADNSINRVVATVFHAITIHWFIRHRTQLPALWLELEKYATAFDTLQGQPHDTPLYAAEIRYQQRDLATDWCLFTEHTTRLLAFMRVKSLVYFKASDVVKDQGYALADHYCLQVNTLAQELNTALADGTPILPLIQRLRSAYDSMIISFALLEKIDTR